MKCMLLDLTERQGIREREGGQQTEGRSSGSRGAKQAGNIPQTEERNSSPRGEL